jgi:hypothetical protein
MALFVDGPINGAQALRHYESSLLDVAGTEGIDLGGKLDLAHREVAVELTAFLVRAQELSGNQRDVSKLIVTEPLGQWEALHTLALFFRDAYHNQLNDRFKGKWQEYSRMAKIAAGRLFEIGVGLSAAPIPQGSAPTVEVAAGGGLEPATYYVGIAWRNASGEQGKISALTEVDVASGQTLIVAPESLPATASAYVVYVGLSPEELLVQDQNASAQWAMPAGGLLSNLNELPQQSPGYYVTKAQGLLRG